MGKPFFRQQTQSYYFKLGDRFISLGKDLEKAETKWHEIMAGQDPGESTISTTVLLKRYAEWFERARAPTTVRSRIPKLKSFSRMHGRRQAAQIKPHHVRSWVRARYPKASPTYESDLIMAVQAAFQWGADEGFLRQNPIRRVRKPNRRSREEFIPREHWRALLRACGTRELRTIAWFSLATGARAEEIPIIGARHIHDARVILPASQSKGKHRALPRPRIIYLPDRTATRLRGLCQRHPSGPLFRNSRGEPWNKNSVNCAIKRTRQRLKWHKLCFTMLRHSFAHDHARRGTDALVLAELMGHADTRMLSRVYAHVGQATDALLAAANHRPR